MSHYWNPSQSKLDEIGVYMLRPSFSVQKLSKIVDIPVNLRLLSALRGVRPANKKPYVEETMVVNTRPFP